MGMFMVVVVRMLQYLETFLKVMLLFQKRGNMENVIKTNQKIKINLIFILKLFSTDRKLVKNIFTTDAEIFLSIITN